MRNQECFELKRETNTNEKYHQQKRILSTELERVTAEDVRWIREYSKVDTVGSTFRRGVRWKFILFGCNTELRSYRRKNAHVHIEFVVKHGRPMFREQAPALAEDTSPALLGIQMCMLAFWASLTMYYILNARLVQGTIHSHCPSDFLTFETFYPAQSPFFFNENASVLKREDHHLLLKKKAPLVNWLCNIW